jgi:GMP synthase (glutamine-hydrolysing)
VRVLAIVHQPDAGPGVFADAIRGTGALLDCWRPPEGDPAPRDPGEYDAVLSFGGAMNADQESRHPWLAEEKALLARLLEHDVPVLGVCLGAQLLAEAAGASARRAREPEIGWYAVEVTDAARTDPLLAPLAAGFDALEWHSYEAALPPGAVALASSPVCLQAYRIGDVAWGIQFHAEVTLQDFERWLDDYRNDADAVRIGIDVDGLRSVTRSRIAAWNDLGRGLCERFVRVAAERAGP